MARVEVCPRATQGPCGTKAATVQNSKFKINETVLVYTNKIRT